MAAAGGGGGAKGLGSKVKILLVGPRQCGKTCVANFVGDVVDSLEAGLDRPYEPTVGVRIVEFDRELRGIGRVEVELWDVSGDSQYEPGWPAILKDASGVVLMFDPTDAGQTQQINSWHEFFVARPGTKPGNCIALAHSTDLDASERAAPEVLRGVSVRPTAWSTRAAVRDAFDRVISAIASGQ